MNSTHEERFGVPFTVRIRAYISHVLIASVSFAAYLLIFAFIAGIAVGAAAERRRAVDAPHNEIVIAGEKNGEESFLYLKNYAISGEKGKNAVSDVLMLLPGNEYFSNNIYFRGTLSEGTCAVSANVASKYGLDVGDRARVIGTDKTFEVVRLLTAQDGLDENYKHEGLIVLSYDEDLLDRNYMYLSFLSDGDAYRSLDKLIFVEDMKKDSAEELFLCAVIALLAVSAVMTLSELLLFRARREDYKTLSLLGTGARKLFCRILGESLLRYALPAFLAADAFLITYAPYADAYYIPALCFAGVCILLSAIYSFIVIRRLYYVKSK